jgi:hypothetical protein
MDEIRFDMDVMKRAASIGCTVEEIAAVLGMGRSTFYGQMERYPEIKEALEEARENGRATLRRIQWQRANAGSDTMLIWLGKNMLKQTDRTELLGKDGGALSLIITGVRREDDA